MAISAKLAPLRIAIVGLGGTGSYVLDLVAKTSVREIHLFDDDLFLQHNAFRAPGAASLDDLRRQLTKVQYLHDLYSKMRSGSFLIPSVSMTRTFISCTNSTSSSSAWTKALYESSSSTPYARRERALSMLVWGSR